MKRPAIRIIFAPLQTRKGKYIYFLEGLNIDRTIYIDPRGNNPASTLIHERMHMDHPDWSEEKVEWEEGKWWRKASWREKAEVYQLLGRGKIGKVAKGVKT